MKYVYESEGKLLKADDISTLAGALRKGPRPDMATLSIRLPIPLSGRVQRNRSTPEAVILTSGARVHTFVRRTQHNPNGDIGISCDPIGNEVPVQSINLEFRDYDDVLTDRGVVWVMPGEPATALLVFHPNRFGKSGDMFASIVAAAEAKIHREVLRHFVN